MTVQFAQPAQVSQSSQSEQVAQPDIICTWTDEVPMLATHSFLPIVYGFAQRVGVNVGTVDISLAGRTLTAFSLAGGNLARLDEFTQPPAATIIKLPNISVSLPQLKAAIAKLQALGHETPDYPDSPIMPVEHEVCAAYDAIKGSAVNPILREDNSDRRAPTAVKVYACSCPHSMGTWSPQPRTRVATMGSGDFRHNERSVVVPEAGTPQIRLRPTDGSELIVLWEPLPVIVGEVMDATFMSAAALDEFFAQQVSAAKDENLLLLVHPKVTMMKVSDPIIFGHAVRTALSGAFPTYGRVLAETGLCAEDELTSIPAGLDSLPQGEQIHVAIGAKLAAGLRLSTVDSDRGTTNLHVPSDVIIDTSMPTMIRTGGHLWEPDGQTADTPAVVPNSSYARAYQAVIDDCRVHGALDPAIMGSMPNVGLMACKVEEYGSHDKTSLIPADDIIEAITVEGADTEPGTVLLSYEVAIGDTWRACTTQDVPIRDWVHLAVTRARATGTLAVFWLDPEHGHDVVLIDLMNCYLTDKDTEGPDIRVLDPVTVTRLPLERARHDEDTISVVGNVLCDYNTDPFPILELDMSAKMLLVVSLMSGGGPYETGVGGSAPKYVCQLLEEDYLRWGSLGEFLALVETFHHVAQVSGDERAEVLADALEAATARLPEENRSPAHRLGQTDNRGSHAWPALYWARELAAQETSPELAAAFSLIAQQLEVSSDTTQAELLAAQGSPVDIGGHYRPDTALINAAMRPLTTLNAVIEALA